MRKEGKASGLIGLCGRLQSPRSRNRALLTDRLLLRGLMKEVEAKYIKTVIFS